MLYRNQNCRSLICPSTLKKDLALSVLVLIEKGKRFVLKKVKLTKKCAFSDGWLSKFKVRGIIQKQ